MIEHHDFLENLNTQGSLRDKLISAHQSIKALCPDIDRIAVAIYDPETKVLKTYLHSSGTDDPLSNYQSLIDQAPSLKAILEKGLPRVINNMVTFEDGEHQHTQRVGRAGYAASYTLPMFNNGEFFGFIFYNSRKRGIFTESLLNQLDVFGHLIALMVINELSSSKALSAAVKTTQQITHQRDPETGSHLDRMSRYSLLIARQLVAQYELDDEYLMHIFMFAPLHDIGKIAIPDDILFKPGPLDENEAAVMRTHAQKGREMIEEMIENFGLSGIQHVELLRNIAGLHHEAVNGTGYPEGKRAEEIPLEARIVAVADVFDALTSERPYKLAWSNQQAIDTLKQLAGEKLDQDCVNALIDNMDTVEAIQAQFKETPYV
ncbi:MAG: HD domain-containing protein [Thiohalophilus sp.]|uniref:HD domain-containing phosphohydrolase n=1 Tax=Thiohalophilus sp. TaxID=3028392 RepID=UPI002870795B|nr:HD domain-containing phosphohydrolase [Thiohalophilus sp.]MDR9437081.1 HD domain-containing protein [Thiohalophilus sp.]